MSNSEIIERWAGLIEVQRQFRGIGGRYRLWVRGGAVDERYLIDLENDPHLVRESSGVPLVSADAELSISECDFPLLVEGRLNLQSAFLSGRVKVAGKLAFVLKLSRVLTKLMGRH